MILETGLPQLEQAYAFSLAIGSPQLMQNFVIYFPFTFVQNNILLFPFTLNILFQSSFY